MLSTMKAAGEKKRPPLQKKALTIEIHISYRLHMFSNSSRTVQPFSVCTRLSKHPQGHSEYAVLHKAQWATQKGHEKKKHYKI